MWSACLLMIPGSATENRSSRSGMVSRARNFFGLGFGIGFFGGFGWGWGDRGCDWRNHRVLLLPQPNDHRSQHLKARQFQSWQLLYCQFQSRQRQLNQEPAPALSVALITAGMCGGFSSADRPAFEQTQHASIRILVSPLRATAHAERCQRSRELRELRELRASHCDSRQHLVFFQSFLDLPPKKPRPTRRIVRTPKAAISGSTNCQPPRTWAIHLMRGSICFSYRS
jgi:hypothetical protein